MTLPEQLEHYFDRLWPICRSLTGDGVRASLSILQEAIPLQVHEVASGTPAFDWEVPDEWNIRDAYILAPDGRKIADFQQNNLHVLGYSTPIDQEMSWDELAPHLYTLPDMPDAIPYLTSYYNRNWGFCLTHREWETLPHTGAYRVKIDSTLAPGSMTWGDLILPGTTDREILFSTYVCHPSMANNELSGPLVAAFLYQKIAAMPERRFTYRFVFAPETIGIIHYLSRHGMHMKEVTEAGYVLTCVGDAGDYVLKQSKRGNSLADQVAAHVLKHQPVPHTINPFFAIGSDERQYCSPGFNMPVASVTRSMYHRYKEYHTSLDNKDFISFEAMEKTIDMYFNIVQVLEANQIPVNTNPYCEPRLGKRGLYSPVGGLKERSKWMPMMMHLLAYADGSRSLLEIAELQHELVLDYLPIVHALRDAGLLTLHPRTL